MIHFAEVGRTFGMRVGRRIDALRDVSFDVHAGESMAVVGPNGAGKSTLLALVLGFLRPTTGELSVGDSLPNDWVRRNGAGWLPERFNLPADWTVRGSLTALARLEGRSSDARTRVDGLLERFGLQKHARRSVGALSRGLLQRLGIAQAMMAARRLVILDEPTNGLDPDGRTVLRETVSELRNGGTTFVIASHDLAELERLTDRALLLETGTVREILDVRPATVSGAWVIRAAAPETAMRSVFPEARQLEAGADSSRWAVTVTDAEDLNARLARLIAAGGLIFEVSPSTPTLEERLRPPPPGAAGP